MKFAICLATTLLALSCLVLQSSSATYSSRKLSRDTAAIIKDLQSAIEILKDASSSMKDMEKIEALIQYDDGGDDAVDVQQLSQIFQLQLALRDLIRAIARLERSIRRERRG
jgi:hypothetical protein